MAVWPGSTNSSFLQVPQWTIISGEHFCMWKPNEKKKQVTRDEEFKVESLDTEKLGEVVINSYENTYVIKW